MIEFQELVLTFFPARSEYTDLIIQIYMYPTYGTFPGTIDLTDPLTSSRHVSETTVCGCAGTTRVTFYLGRLVICDKEDKQT